MCAGSTSSISRLPGKRHSNAMCVFQPSMHRVPQSAHHARRNEGRRVADCRHGLDGRGVAGAELMTAASSPGRTWSRVGRQRGLRALARSLPTAVRVSRRRKPCLSGMARLGASGSPAHQDDAADLLGKLRHNRRDRRRPGRSLASISLALAVLCTSVACRPAAKEPDRHDGFRRVVAHVRGIT